MNPLEINEKKTNQIGILKRINGNFTTEKQPKLKNYSTVLSIVNLKMN